ncbi:hypothetical protein [Haloarchaeobius litoreus]|uniref:DUF8173 domain-containing protein n=1 Tax=Haloarchaeobius litoreus TaxID=755306 RepID=A0ABD6DGK9_9EURY|nr:hypothetical protein [Haloarchaeobius litoreus]
MISQLTSIALQSGFDPDPSGLDVAVNLGGSAVSAFLTTLVVGAIMVALAPDYTRRMMNAVREDAVGSFVYGLVLLLGLVVAIVLLAVTIIGIVLAIPLALVASLVWAVGAAIGYLAIAERLVKPEPDEWLGPLLVAAGLNGLLVLTGIGGIVSFCIGAAGFGAVLRDWLD